ncbi:MAG TPA: hypothetical protein VFT04_04365 [Gemmatimonadales bacterium]|nr:hypothetical protein [Gemmatimonadales bacterium]
MRRIVARCTLALLLVPGTLASQGGTARLAVLLDVPAADSAYTFDRMPPGWHVTMGPGAILTDSAHRAEGRFVVESEIFLFPNSSASEYGIVLAKDGADWTGFLLRRDGTAAIVRFAGGVATPIVAWSAHDSVPKPSADAPARVVARVEAERDSTHFSVNGTRVASALGSAAPVDGVFGLRIGPGVNVHVSRLDYTRRLAPPRGE